MDAKNFSEGGSPGRRHSRQTLRKSLLSGKFKRSQFGGEGGGQRKCKEEELEMGTNSSRKRPGPFWDQTQKQHIFVKFSIVTYIPHLILNSLKTQSV